MKLNLRYFRLSAVSAMIIVALFMMCGVASVSAAGRHQSAVRAPAQSQNLSVFQMFVTFYGWLDNSPPGADIAYPQIHSQAGGTGTFSDPITFATDQNELAPGTIVYVPYVQKYFIMEDDCAECDSDWGNGMRHIDLWTGGNSNSGNDLINCEDNLTQNGDVPVVVNPPTGLTVSSQVLFNSNTHACFSPSGGELNLYQGESSANTLTGGARVTSCAGCSDGKKVGFIGKGATLAVNGVSESARGTYQVLVLYCDGDAGRAANISANGGSARSFSFANTGGWSTIGVREVSLSLNAGSNSMLFANASAWAPDVDAIIA